MLTRLLSNFIQRLEAYKMTRFIVSPVQNEESIWGHYNDLAIVEGSNLRDRVGRASRYHSHLCACLSHYLGASALT